MVFQSSDENSKKALARFCQVSNTAILGDPRRNRNYRNNPSLLLSLGNGKNVLIDAGKTFREGALRWFPANGVTSLDAIVLTHHHMDAAGGLDDVRGFQRWKGLGDSADPPSPYRAVPMPLYLSLSCLEDTQERFPWLFPKETPERTLTAQDENEGKSVVKRHVATFEVHVMEGFQSYNVEGIEIVPLPVMHGEDLVSFGFAFTLGRLNVVYLSDISRMLPETLEFIRNRLPQTSILVIDALHPTKRTPVHYTLEEALEVAKLLQPTQMTYLVGMNCDSFLPHDDINQQLQATHGNVRLAHDGLVLDASQSKEA
jgi:phosphoribosyl 1,2-cyclic phosphodiesterase